MREAHKTFIRFAALACTALSLTLQTAQASLVEEGGIPETYQGFNVLYVKNVFVKLLLNSYGKSDAERIQSVKDAETLITKFAFQKRDMHLVETVAELEEIKKLYFPDGYSVRDEARLLVSSRIPPYLLITTQNDEVKSALQHLINKDITKFFGPALSSQKFRSHYFNLLNQPLKARATLSLVPDSARLQLANSIHSVVKQGVDLIDSIGDRIANSDEVQIQNKAQQRFMQLALGEYFKGLSAESKLDMIAGLIDNPQAKSNLERFEVMILRAGPQFQKMLQASAREAGMSPELQASMKKLEQNTRAAPWRLVEPMLKEAPVDFEWLDIKQKAVKAGSMAQIHKARIRLKDGTEKAVAVRFLKPGIKEGIDADTKSLQHIASKVDSDPVLIAENFPKLTPFLKEIEQMALLERDVSLTVNSTRQGANVYASETKTPQGRVRLHVPEIRSVGGFSVQDWVDGVSFEKFMEEHPERARAAIEVLATKWLNEALFGGGFYHADLHQGNLMVSESRGATVLNILDFGMAGQIGPDLQNKFLAFAALIESHQPEIMAKIAWELSTLSENRITREQLENLFREEIAKSGRKSFFEWAGVAVNAGIKFPSELTSLNRGAYFIFRMLHDNQIDGGLPKVIKNLILRNPLKAAQIVQSTKLVSKSEWARALYGQVQNIRAKAAVENGRARASLSCSAAFN